MTISSLLEGGFRLIRERPGAMLIWTVVQLAVAIATSFARRSLKPAPLRMKAGQTIPHLQSPCF